MPEINLDDLGPLKPTEAREQAAEFLGFMAGIKFDIGNGETWELPNASLLDDEQTARYAQYQLDTEGLDRHPDTTDANGNTVRGALMDPNRKDGKLVEQSDVRLAKALMGNAIHKKFVAAGGRSSQIAIHWWAMRKAQEDRQKQDSKSLNSSGGVGEVSGGDRVGSADVSPAADS